MLFKAPLKQVAKYTSRYWMAIRCGSVRYLIFYILGKVAAAPREADLYNNQRGVKVFHSIFDLIALGRHSHWSPSAFITPAVACLFWLLFHQNLQEKYFTEKHSSWKSLWHDAVNVSINMSTLNISCAERLMWTEATEPKSIWTSDSPPLSEHHLKG